MNAEQVLEIITELRDTLDATEIEERLEQLEGSVRQIINQPASSPLQEAMKDSAQALREELQAARASEHGSLWREAVNDLNLENLLAGTIERKVDAIFQDSQLTPNIALGELRELRQSIEQTKARVVQTIDGLESLGFHIHEIPADKAEISMLVPRAAIDNSLDRLSKELHIWNRLLKAIGEAANEDAEDIQIQSLASSDLLITVVGSCTLVRLFAGMLNKLLECYKNILEIRKLCDGLHAKGVEKDNLSGIEGHVSEQLKRCIDAAVTDLLQQYHSTAAGRKNELKTQLKKALWTLAQDIDKGYNFDVRANEPEESSESDPEKSVDEIINDIRRALDFSAVKGEHIVSLPPGQKVLSDPDDDAG